MTPQRTQTLPPRAGARLPAVPVMADVARRAGVSTMTVSRVLNGSPRVSDGTRGRVNTAIAALGYRANVAARTLAGGSSRVLGALSLKTEYYGPSNTLFGIENAARRAGHLVSFVALNGADTDEMRAAIGHLRSTQVEGLIVVAPLRSAAAALTEIDADLPIVATTGSPGFASTVSIDQRAGARLATRHLLELGHATVHHVRGPRGWFDADARAAGWRAELTAWRRPVPAVVGGDWSPDSGYAAGRCLAADPSVTAVFVANDQMALGVLLALHEARRSVPEHISVVGFDDTPEAGFFVPPLTTVRQDFDELGRHSVDQLLARVAGDAPRRTVIDPHLRIRASTAPPTRHRRRSVPA